VLQNDTIFLIQVKIILVVGRRTVQWRKNPSRHIIYRLSGLTMSTLAGLLTLPVAVLGHEISEFIGSELRMLRG
jgi:hypothetical protein